MAKYKILGKNIYMCTVCETIHEGPNSRNLAIRCYESHQDGPQTRPYSARPRLEKEPGEGILYPDRYGHWRRGSRRSILQRAVEIKKALHQADKQEKKELAGVLRQLYRIYRYHNPKISPLRRLSYAYHFGGWEAVKQAAQYMAYSKAVQNRLDEMNIPRILQFTLRLSNILAEFAVRRETMSEAEVKAEINSIMSRLEIDSLLDAYESGEKDDDESEKD